MIKDKVFKLKEDAIAPFNIELKKNQEISVVIDVVYLNGYMLQKEMQSKFYDWIVNNPNLFTDETRNWNGK